MNDGVDAPDTQSKSDRRLLDLYCIDDPAYDDSEREPPDKRRLRSKLREQVAALVYTRCNKEKEEEPELEFDGCAWTRDENGQWDTSMDHDVEQLKQYNNAAVGYFDMAARDGFVLHKIDKQSDAEQSQHPQQPETPYNYAMQSDTGANVNATPHLKCLQNVVWIQPSSINTAKKGAPTTMMTAHAIGQMPLVADGRMSLVNTYYIPDAANTIISPTAIVDQFSEEFYAFYHYANMNDSTGVIKFLAREGYNDWSLPVHCANLLWWHYDEGSSPSKHTPARPFAHIAALSDAAKYELWHQRIGHMGQYVMNNIHNTSDGVPKLRGNAFYRCPSCMASKATKQPTHERNPLGSVKTTPTVSPPPAPNILDGDDVDKVPTEPGNEDVCKPVPLDDTPFDTDAELESFLDEIYLPDAHPGQHFHVDHGFVRGSDYKSTNEKGQTVTSIDGKRSYCLIVDRATRYMWVYAAATKDPPINAVRTILAKFKSNHKHKTVRTDQDKSLGECAAFKLMVEKEDFTLELTGSDASVQNSRAERPHRDLGQIMRCLLHGVDLGSEYWSYALTHAVYLKNRVPHSTLKCSPYEKFTGQRPNLAHLKVFGSVVYAKNPGRRKAKLDNNTSRGTFLGFSATNGNIYFRDEKTRKIKLGTHVMFDEAHMTTSARRAPIAAEALQRLGYHARESWIDTELKMGHSADVRNAMLVEKLTSTATTPACATEGSIGYDLVSDVQEITIHPGEIELISTGVAVRAPPGSYLRIAPRSGLTVKRRLHTMAGVVDPDYTGNIMIVLQNFGTEAQTIKRGDKVAQLIVERADKPTVQLVDHLPGTDRGANGFGSTDHNKKEQTSVAPPDTPKISSTILKGLQLEFELPYDVHLSNDMFDFHTYRNCAVTGTHPTLGLDLRTCPSHGRAQLLSCLQATPAAKIARWKRELRNGYVTAVNDIPVRTLEDVKREIDTVRKSGATNVKISFSTIRRQAVHPQTGVPQIYTDQLNIVAEHLWEMAYNPDWQKEVLGSVPEVEKMLENEEFHEYLKSRDAKEKIIHAVKTKTLKQQRKLTRRILMQRDDWEEWKQSEWKQLDQYCDQDTFGPPVKPPPNVNKLSLLWTYIIKDSGVKKARCVCNGSKKMRGSVTLAETYASSLEQTASRVFWAATAMYNFVTIGADASNAFAEAPPPVAPLYVHVDEPYREWHYARTGEWIPRGYVMRVKKALQGHPESARLWSVLIDRVIKELNLQPCTHEPNLYYTNDYAGTGHTVLFLRQVDDFAIACQDNDTAKDVVRAIDSKMTIKVKELGPITRYNGVDVTQRRHYVKISNATYIEKILANHPWLTNEKFPPMSYPLPMNPEATYQRKLETAEPLEQAELDSKYEKMGFTYRQVIGELLFALITCRPDISYATIKLSQYSTKTNSIHIEAAQKILAYLRDTKDDGIYYWRKTPRMDLPIGELPQCRRDDNYDHYSIPECQQHEDHILFGAKDSDFAGDTSHRKSVTGVIIKLAGGTVLYKTAFQATTALSSTEAEFTAAATAGKYILYLRTIMEEIGIPQEAATILYEDNQGALLMANAQKPTKRTRHMDIKAFALQEWVERDLLVVKRICTSDNYSDAMTKALGRTLFYRHNDYIMGRVIPEYVRPTLAQISALTHDLSIDYDSNYRVSLSDHISSISYRFAITGG